MIDDGMTERQWQALVRELANLTGWRTWHQYDSRKSDPGYPDLMLLRPPEAIWAELKTNGGRVSDAQRETTELMIACGLETHIWRPRDLTRVHERLRLKERRV
jgi:hypothetical protein